MQADNKTKKGSAYSKRISNSIAAPPDIDSDSDFNNGAVPKGLNEKKEKKPKTTSKKRKNESMDSDDSARPRIKGKKRQQTSDFIDDSDASEKPEKKKQKTKKAVARTRRPKDQLEDCPLLEYFKNMDVHSDSSEGDPEMEDEPSDDPEDSYDSDMDVVPPVNSFQAYANRKPPACAPTGGGSGETTDDDDDEGPPVPIRKPSPPRKLPKPAVDSDATGSDSGEEPPKPVSRPAPTKPNSKLKPKPVPPSLDSETDPDSDFELPVKPIPKEDRPRPGFALLPGQKPLGPMVLDAKQGIQVPAAINTYLRDYQREGVKFFWERYNENRGGLLGDDMGLGKTIQVISFLSAIMKKTGTKKDRKRRRKHVAELQAADDDWRTTLPPANATWPTCLIMAPATVVMNWEREFARWGYFEVGCLTGTRDERKDVLRDFDMGRLDVLLTSLDLGRRDIEKLHARAWSCVFVDEVHIVKNPKSKTSLAYDKFLCERRFGLTGTAIQNSYDELWTVLNWTNPGKLGDRAQWRSFISTPLRHGQSASATDHQRFRAVTVSNILHKDILPRFFLRRTKSIIAHQLPQKTDEVVFCPLTSPQIAAYKKILAMEEVQGVVNRNEPCACGSGHQQKDCCIPFDSANIFKFLHVLIKLSNHLGLILPSPNDTKEQLIRNRELASIAFPNGQAPPYTVAIMDKQYCGKWAVLLSLLRDWRKDRTNKVLIFTKSVKLLEMMAHQLKVVSYGFLQLDGHTKQSERMAIIDQFHDDPEVFIFLISTMAGGTGLNLTGANKVVIFDPNWNPAHDLQAMDRAFRFGQTRDVSVVRLLGAGSVEELIYARQVYKQQQMKIGYENSIQTRYFEGVQGEKTKQGELFGLNNIFKLHEGGLSTKTAIEKAHLAELDWALETMDAPAPAAKGKNRKSNTGAGNEEINDFKGLEMLLFDDALPPAARKEDSEESGAAVRGMYTHQNSDLLKDSKIEQDRTRDIVNTRKKKAKKSDPAGPGSPSRPWPPPRVHKRIKGNAPKFEDRRKALIGTGMIKNASEIAQFARAFTREYTEEQQAYTMHILDSYRAESDDEDSQAGDDDDGMDIEREPEDIDMD
ncbi:P-loop containing nucleoside triphosphate hydrolase protein [Mycena alexandri]|uniref:P-loop containing nucleoside triphosphate hydrolase protein n=1 Tax=Mycena alexandri TaxID=1745969 RepID=A0AAD6T809_9AGAR|nr:P-loop containing nucleoside triphosphate hydrolase protein [Mycena alexandri]